MTRSEKLIQAILAAEWRMFQKVKSASPASCQNNPEAFNRIRGSIFQLWPAEMIEAYLEELKAAQEKGRNLMTEKYARMDNLIPAINTNPLIEKIVDVETSWQEELELTYPELYRRTCRHMGGAKGGSHFSIYLRCELETYGDKAIALYYSWVRKGLREKQNYSVFMLERLVKKGGFASLDQAERYYKQINQGPPKMLHGEDDEHHRD